MPAIAALSHQYIDQVFKNSVIIVIKSKAAMLELVLVTCLQCGANGKNRVTFELQEKKQRLFTSWLVYPKPSVCELQP
jgi:hypothetical protein